MYLPTPTEERKGPHVSESYTFYITRKQHVVSVFYPVMSLYLVDVGFSVRC